MPKNLELTAIPWLRRMLLHRWPQWLITVAALSLFVYAIVAGFAGTPVGSRNIAITLVWIAWWGLLILILVPAGGRLWCSVCPIPAVGDWLQRKGALASDGLRKAGGLGKAWPRKLRNLWPQNIAFLGLGLSSAVILTQPRVSAGALLGLLVLATVVSLVFQRRTFCRHLCPVGGFIGLYSLASPLALRVKDPQLCTRHPTKECYRGSQQGHGCPWMVYPGTLRRNAACGLCMECLRTCPLDNVALVLQRPGKDLVSLPARVPLSLDEAYKGFIMMGAAVTYSAIFLGPWGAWKQAAYQVGSLPWMGYALTFLALALLGVPSLYYLAAWAGRALARNPSIPLQQSLLRSVAGLVPLGLAAWMAFSLSLVLTNGSYVPSSMSDPLGWGWNLFGTAQLPWQPVLSGLVRPLQVAILFLGLAWSTVVTIRATSSAHPTSAGQRLSAAPTLLVNLGMVMLLGWLYL